jgi:hypothetical protein
MSHYINPSLALISLISRLHYITVMQGPVYVFRWTFLLKDIIAQPVSEPAKILFNQLSNQA